MKIGIAHTCTMSRVATGSNPLYSSIQIFCVKSTAVSIQACSHFLLWKYSSLCFGCKTERLSMGRWRMKRKFRLTHGSLVHHRVIHSCIVPIEYCNGILGTMPDAHTSGISMFGWPPNMCLNWSPKVEVQVNILCQKKGLIKLLTRIGTKILNTNANWNGSWNLKFKQG